MVDQHHSSIRLWVESQWWCPVHLSYPRRWAYHWKLLPGNLDEEKILQRKHHFGWTALLRIQTFIHKGLKSLYPGLFQPIEWSKPSDLPSLFRSRKLGSSARGRKAEAKDLKFKKQELGPALRMIDIRKIYSLIYNNVILSRSQEFLIHLFCQADPWRRIGLTFYQGSENSLQIQAVDHS